MALPMLLALHSNGQNFPQPELSAGIRIGFGAIEYDAGATNAEGTMHINPQLRYQHPVRLFRGPDKDVYINLVGGVGYLYLPGKGNATTSNYEIIKSPSLHYIPVSLGIYGNGLISPGIEATYWKGLGHSDHFSMKLLSLMFSIGKFRAGAAWEMAGLVSSGPTTHIISGSLFYTLWKRQE